MYLVPSTYFSLFCSNTRSTKLSNCEECITGVHINSLKPGTTQLKNQQYMIQLSLCLFFYLFFLIETKDVINAMDQSKRDSSKNVQSEYTERKNQYPADIRHAPDIPWILGFGLRTSNLNLIYAIRCFSREISAFAPLFSGLLI